MHSARKIAVPAIATALLLTSCSSSDTADDASPSEAGRGQASVDGTQSYATLEDLQSDMFDRAAVTCRDLREEPNPAAAAAAAQASCDFGGNEFVLQLWDDGQARDDGVSDLLVALPTTLDYCWVLGRGDQGAWSINASGDNGTCNRLADALGGEVYDYTATTAATTASAAPPAVAAPTVFTGSGDTVVPITKPAGSDIVIATITGNDAGRLFAVQGIDGDQDLLVNTTDPYSGSVLMDLDQGGTTQLQVSAVGDWSITLSDVTTAPTLEGSASGSGDAVYLYFDPAGVAAITGNAAGRLFSIQQYTGSGRNLLVNTTDPYTGTVPIEAGPSFVQINAVDAWTIAVS